MCLSLWACAESGGSGYGSDSGSDEEEAETGDVSKLQEMEMAMGTGVSPEAISKAKQSRSEKKARKVLLKLGLKNIPSESIIETISVYFLIGLCSLFTVCCFYLFFWRELGKE